MNKIRNRLIAELKAVKDAKFAPHGNDHPPEATCNNGMYVTKFPFKGYDDKEAAKKRAIVKANQSSFIELPETVRVDNIKNYLDGQPMENLRVELKKSDTLFGTNPREAKRVEMDACEKVHNHIENLEFALAVLEGKYKSPVVKTKIDYYDPVAVFEGLNKFAKQMCSGGSKRKMGDAKIQEFKDLKSTLDVQTKAYDLDDYASDDIYDGLVIKNCGMERLSHVGKRTDEQALSALKEYEELMLHLAKTRNNYVTDRIHEPTQAELRTRTGLLNYKQALPNKIYENQMSKKTTTTTGSGTKSFEIKRYAGFPEGFESWNPYRKMAWTQMAACEKRNPPPAMVDAAEKFAKLYVKDEEKKALERVNNTRFAKCGEGHATYKYLKPPKSK